MSLQRKKALCRAAAVCSLFLTTITNAVVKPSTTPYYRLEGGVNHLRINRQASWAAFTDGAGAGLKILNLKNGAVFKVTDDRVGASFFWSPNGFRLFYRQLGRNKPSSIESQVLAYDVSQHKSIAIAAYPTSSGYLSYDPRDLRFHLLHEKGVASHKLYFPDQRLARWQVAQRHDTGKWLATQKSMIHLTQTGLKMRSLEDDNSGIESFTISPDGSSVAWATLDGNVYTADASGTVNFVGAGRDPDWHPLKPLLVYAAARRIGHKDIDYDLRVVDVLKRRGKYLTRTPNSKERWGRFLGKGEKLLYAIANTTDLYILELK